MSNLTTAIGSRAVKCCGRGRVDAYSVAIDTTGTDVTVKAVTLDANSQKKASQVALVGGTSTKTAGVVDIKFSSLNPLDNTTKTVLGHLVIQSGYALDKDMKNQIVDGIVSLPGESLIVQSDTAITLYLDTVTGDSLQVLSTT